MRFVLLIPILLLLAACSDIGYYWHSSKGHLSIMSQRNNIQTLLEDPDFDVDLKQRLRLIQTIRAFSIEVLSLPDNGSYTDFVRLDRPYVLQNMFAAAEFSIQLKSWCYPIVGCASYRGYYDDEMLNAYAEQLRQQNFDVHIGQVAAYSTLGWFDDPVLSSFIDWPDYRLAGLLFHELTHQRLYIDGDTQFNESLAVAVQQAGTILWLQSTRNTDQLDEYERWISYFQQVVELIEQTRNKLAIIYQTDLSDASKREEKKGLLAMAGDTHAEIARAHRFKTGFTHWFAEGLNNAKLASVSTYNALTPAFLAMLEAHDNQFSAFFDYVKTIGNLDKEIRDRCLALWADHRASINKPCQ